MCVYIEVVLDGAVASTTRWELYRVLAEPVRLRLLALAAEEELAIGELATLLGESQPNISRHLTPLKQAGLVLVRREGTRALVRIAEAATADPVVADALASGRALCEGDGSLPRLAEILRDRDRVAREFFAQANVGELLQVTDANAAYVAALARLLPSRALAVDAGTGDGGLLDVLAPAFEKVIAVDRSGAQLERARARVSSRGYTNVKLLKSELAAPELREAVGAGADVVFASRLLHHAPRPVDLVTQLAQLARPNGAGAIVVVDYARHDDESMRDEADLWLGFEPAELKRFARDAGLEGAEVVKLPSAFCGRGKDAHLPWQVMIAKTVEKKK